MTNSELFKNWNEVLCSYFFPNDIEEDAEVSLYIDKDEINELGREHELGGYDEFMRIIMLPEKERQEVYKELRRCYINTSLSREQRTKLNSKNIFDFATIYIDSDFYKCLDCPFLIYIVFIILMGSECQKNNKNRGAIGNYITDELKKFFPNHNNDRTAFKQLFNALADQHPQFHAEGITENPYIGLIKYQLGLSKKQVELLTRAMYRADLSEELPYDMWIRKIRDYVDVQMKDLLDKSVNEIVLKKRISGLRSNFDPIQYELIHQEEDIVKKGKFVLAVYEDDYSEEEDRLVLLTDVNNKTISDGNIKITKGTIDRLGEYAEYNVNHVLVGGSDKAQMKTYSLKDGENKVTSMLLGNIVIFTRCSNNYLIQTNYPQKGKETYILVKNGHEEEWGQWLIKHDSPRVKEEMSTDRKLQIFGKGWNMFISNEIEIVDKAKTSSHGSSIIMEGGIRCVGKNKVYLRTGLPYFEFPEPIDENKLEIFIGIENKGLEDEEYNYLIVDDNRLVIDLMNTAIGDHSLDICITLEYKIGKGKKLRLHEEFSVIGQDIRYSEDVLFKMNMWGGISTEENAPYMKGMKVFNSEKQTDMPEGTGFYQNKKVDLDILDRRFYLVNLIAAECSMRSDFSITEQRLKKCIRYAATRFGINVASESTFYTDVKFLLLNSGYINADFEQGKYQPVPPAFLKTAAGFDPGKHIFMLVGSYTQKFLCDLKNYCRDQYVSIYLHECGKGLSKGEELIPPVILLQHNFSPDEFKKNTNSMFLNAYNEDVAINIVNALHSYKDYESSWEHVSPNVFDPRILEAPDCLDFPRIRRSKATGYNSSTWIERSNNDYNRVTIPDLAWAYLYCLYKKQKNICTKDIDKLLFPGKLHLPVMMQRALYILNFGVPEKVKAFICQNDDDTNVYYNIIKRYHIKDSNSQTRIPLVIRAITGRSDNEQNTSIRHRITPSYKLFIWKNKNRSSRNNRSLLVLTDITGREIYGFGTKKDMNSFKIYLRMYSSENCFSLVDKDNINEVFSKILESNWADMMIKRILRDPERISQCIGVKIANERCVQLPPREEYEIEEIQII